MVYYEVTVFTGSYDDATTFNDVFIKLVGIDGKSERTMLKNEEHISPFTQGKVSLKISMYVRLILSVIYSRCLDRDGKEFLFLLQLEITCLRNSNENVTV